jgi:hypothetical protein
MVPVCGGRSQHILLKFCGWRGECGGIDKTRIESMRFAPRRRLQIIGRERTTMSSNPASHIASSGPPLAVLRVTSELVNGSGVASIGRVVTIEGALYRLSAYDKDTDIYELSYERIVDPAYPAYTTHVEQRFVAQ